MPDSRTTTAQKNYLWSTLQRKFDLLEEKTDYGEDLQPFLLSDLQSLHKVLNILLEDYEIYIRENPSSD